MPTMKSEKERSSEFVKEYRELCKKHKICLVQTYPDVFVALDDNDNGGIEISSIKEEEQYNENVNESMQEFKKVDLNKLIEESDFELSEYDLSRFRK